MARNNIIGNSGSRNILPHAAAIFTGPNMNELIATGPVYKGLTWYTPFELSNFSPTGVPSGGWGTNQTDDGLNSQLISLGGNASIGFNGFNECGTIFDGASGYATMITFDSNFDPFSIAAWIQVPNFTNIFNISLIGNAAVGNIISFDVGGAGDHNGTLICDMGGGDRVHSAATVPTGQPIHVAVTVPSLLSGVRLYINGVQTTAILEAGDTSIAIDGTGSYHSIDWDNVGHTIYGAGNMYGWNYYFKALTPADVLDIYAAGLANRPSYWTMWNEMPLLPFVNPAPQDASSSITGGEFTEKGWAPGPPAKHYTREEYRLLKAQLAREANERRARDVNLSDMLRAKRDAYEALQALNQAETVLSQTYTRVSFDKVKEAKEHYDRAQDRLNELRSIEYIHHLWREHEKKRNH